MIRNTTPRVAAIFKIKLLSSIYLWILGMIIAGCTSIPHVMESPLSAQSPIVPLTQVEPTVDVVEIVSTMTPALSMQLPEPEPGKATVTGVLYSFTGNGPIPETSFYLISENEDARAILTPRNDDIRGRSDIEGRFVLSNIPPGKYFIFVWTPFNWVPIPVSESDDALRVFDFRPDMVTDCGQLGLPWP